MKKKGMWPVALALLLGVSISSAGVPTDLPQNKRAATQAWTEEGLQKITVKGFSVAYIRPGASLAGYDKILLPAIPVSFRRGWEKRSVSGSQLPISAEDAQGIKDRLAGVIRDEFTQQLGEGGYTQVEASADGVLEIDLAIINLDVTAPATSTSGRSRTYATSAGEMSLVATLRDAATGSVVMRLYDHNMARESFRPERLTSVDNYEAAHEAANGWATALRQELDRARGVGRH